MESRPHVQSYLLKRNKEHRKANLIGAKYKRRWVELTKDTLVYASTQQELLTGKIQVFSMHEMIWVKKDGDIKFMVKFPERTLTFKVESGGSSERDKWVAALEASKRMAAEARSSRNSAGKLEQLKKTAEEMLLDPTSPSNDASTGSIQAHRASPPASAAGRAAPRHLAGTAGLELSPNSQSSYRASSAGANPSLASMSVSSHRTTETGQRPLSPRSLLASARAGSAFVSSSSATGGSFAGQFGAVVAQQAGSSAYHGVDEGDSDDDGSSNAGPAAAHARMPSPACVRLTSLDLARSSLEIAKAAKQGLDSAGSGGGHSSCSSPLPLAVAAAAQESNSAGGSPSSRIMSGRRNSLTRQLTPGVMLINTSSPTTPVHSSALFQPTVLPKSAAADASGASGSSSVATSPSKSQQQQQHISTLSSPAAGADENCDEVLRLDPSDLLGQSSGSPGGLVGNAAVASALHGSSSSSSLHGAGARPESGPYRPGTPLKSCLRPSGGSSGQLPQLGSLSSPSSSAAVATAAAAATLGPQHGAGLSSPVHKPSAAGQQGGTGWLLDNWDESSDADEPSPTRAAAAAPIGSSSKQDRVVQSSCDAQAAPLPQHTRIQADQQWLDEDFDD